MDNVQNNMEKSLNRFLDSSVRENVERLDKQTCEEWGGVWKDDTAHVTQYVDEKYITKTEITDHQSAIDAFEKYTEFTDYVINEMEANSESVIIVPCGSTKPVGASASHKKKITAIKESKLYPHCDISIMSEPCSIFPHDMRLSVAATNYDFPPEYTEQSSYPDVFETMAERLAEWIDEREYETIYTYLFARHQNKFERAIEIADANPRVIRIPGASYNHESDNYSGDQFKSTENIFHKLEMVNGLANGEDTSHIPKPTQSFYKSREEYKRMGTQ